MSDEPLTATLGERAALPTLDALEPHDDAALDAPLPSLDPPDGLRVVTPREASAGVARGAPRAIVGAHGASAALVALEVSQRHAARPVLCLVADGDVARALASDLAFFAGEDDVVELPAHEASAYAEIAHDRRAAMQRLAGLARLAERPPRFVVAPASQLARKVLPRARVLSHTTRLAKDTEVDRDALVSALGHAGYLRVPVVEDPGSFSVRGALLDVWPPLASEPVRAEFYGDLLLSLRAFDPDGQRTLGDLGEVLLPPVREAILDAPGITRVKDTVGELADRLDLPSTKARGLLDDLLSARPFMGMDAWLPAYAPLTAVFDHLPADAPIVLDDPPATLHALRDELGRALTDEAARDGQATLPRTALYLSEPEVWAAFDARPVVGLFRGTHLTGEEGSDLADYEIAREDAPTLDARPHDDLARATKQERARKQDGHVLRPLARRIRAWQDAGIGAVVVARTHVQTGRVTELLRHAGIPATQREGRFDPAWAREAERVTVVAGPLARGVLLPSLGLALVTEEDVFGSRAQRRATRERKSKTTDAFLDDLRSLTVGDHVVHSEHGVGRYLGLVHKEVGGHTVDLLVLEYAGADKLYLPIYRLNQVQKLSGRDATPKLDRLGGQTFDKTKKKALGEVRRLADELLRLYAERRAARAERLAPIDDAYRAFEATFPFDETPDQARAIADVMRDLDGEVPMDRLVCGDVGFGKTEVAIRAAFRTAMSGKQVAVLCPTTVLAQQHHLSIEARFRDTPITVAVLSRFQTKAEQADVVRRVKEGKIDVVVGTHRLLSKDLHFARLGLLVVDEEQRFGVMHKERMKQLRRDVPVLTLSATPIPRTLQLAISGLRDMSLITTAPTDRRAIRTLVTRWDDNTIREAIRRELSRGGQVFFVHNRVEGLYERAERLHALVPEARVAVAHGQMAEGPLERVMVDFVDGKYDVLCATAIIESGLDIPRANTILIDRADLLGLSQLYQLRGRVGRSRERAYCYLIVPPEAAMTDESRARIEAIERHSELGSGFHVASLDMELRGAGELLGAEQSGVAATVGFELFCQMLDDAVHELRGEPVVHEVDPDLSFDVEALLPESYVEDVGVRLSLYKRLSSAEDEATVDELASELEDRFGPPPEEARRLVDLMRLKTELRRLRVLGCEASASRVVLHLREDTPLDPAKVMALVQRRGSPFRLTPDMRLSRRFEGERDGIRATERLLTELAPCRRDG